VRSVGHPQAWDPEVIDQAIPLLPEASESRTRSDVREEPPVALGEEALKVWRGERPKAKDTGEIDRSASLVKIGRALFDAGGTRMVIVAALKERDKALGWRKYTGRRDADERYHEIFDELEEHGRAPRLSVRTLKPSSGDSPPNPNGAGTAESFDRHNLTDLGNSERFVTQHGENVRYCYPRGKWLVWTGTRWEQDSSGRVTRLAKETVRSIYREAAAAEDEDTRKALARHATKSEAEARIRAMLELGKSEVPVSPDELDDDPWLLNCPNGTVDLRTGDLRAHDRGDLLTKMAGAEYDLDAEAPTWEAFLERVLPSEDLRGFVRRASGYSATGDTSEQCLFINHGAGANGKSTFQEAFGEALGDYAMRTPTEMLLARRSGTIPNDVARLKGARFVSASETEEGRRLAESLVKDLTGQDTIPARFMRAEWFDFKPSHKLWLSTNHKPEIRGTDHAMWRRIRLIPWSVVIPPTEQDRKLSEKLRVELPGILRWAVQGCIEWRGEGLQAPNEVRRATGEYRAEMDVLGQFVKECCEEGPDKSEAAAALYKAYHLWCEDGGERVISKRKFGIQLRERGFERYRGGADGGHRWRWVSLLTFWKSRICGDSDPSDAKMHINGSKTSHEGNNLNLGSEGSERSAKLPVESVLEELGKDGSGPQKTAKTYLAGETKLEYVVRSVLFARGMNTEGWEELASVVEEALRSWEEVRPFGERGLEGGGNSA
jgi:P4 family phage/plasmid primase-like protien